jgi:hypothetical protein
MPVRALCWTLNPSQPVGRTVSHHRILRKIWGMGVSLKGLVTVFAGQINFLIGHTLCGAVSVTTLATSRATASPYICLTVCCTAIKLLRVDSVAWLVGSLASSA